MLLSPEQSAQWIASRTSVYPKMFDSNELSAEEVKMALGVARWAPTHKLTQPWNFKVFMRESKIKLAEDLGEILLDTNGTDEAVVTKCNKIRFNAECSGAIIAIIMKRDPELRIPEIEEICAVSCAVQNIALHARSMGLGGYWSTGACTNYDQTRMLLNLSKPDIHLGWFFLGRFAGTLSHQRIRKEADSFIELHE